MLNDPQAPSPAEAAARLAVRELVIGEWLFAERKVYVNRLEERALL